MANQTEIRTVADADLTEQARVIFEAAGYSLSDAIRMLLMRTVRFHSVPFGLLQPNETTVQAMQAARRGDLVNVGGLNELFADLHADD